MRWKRCCGPGNRPSRFSGSPDRSGSGWRCCCSTAIRSRRSWTGRVKLVVLSCLLTAELGGDFLQTAQLYAKEIENDADNLDALLDAAYTHPALTDAALLHRLLF